MSQKHFTLFTHRHAPNGWKVAVVLNVLGLPYESRYMNLWNLDVKQPEHTQYNPNGRIPTLIDHQNGDLAVWESNAILLYLVETYDKDHKISVSSPRDKAALNQWLFFQASGQGPYYGQLAWFKIYHSEKIPSAIERYEKETRRVLGVLESVLSKQEYLVGGKLTIADISFVTYNAALNLTLLGEDFDFAQEFPHTAAWHAKVAAVEGVKQGLEERLRLYEEDKAKKAQTSDS